MKALAKKAAPNPIFLPKAVAAIITGTMIKTLAGKKSPLNQTKAKVDGKIMISSSTSSMRAWESIAILESRKRDM